ncbi:hypothetical protein [Intestinibacter bartlettii]|uniref:hypothetical protein n=1 Tax=Intestinibacter bartlettii TaxID=261299 RepID=UPI0034A22496
MRILEDKVKYLPKDISKYPVVRVIGKGRLCLYQIKLEDGRIITYSMPIRGKNKNF